ncbi:hypothetical protein MMYC01_202240 [Madurella mycetomatis]|uniref:Rhodopsin domain-containing protein n=1 Tax=Madurella mycetomatis TaxID=100816 RepID=A0A175WBE6_9PEZI|nr:hypothetical protein MMYC01_202240 [Madurella mycetomatis]
MLRPTEGGLRWQPATFAYNGLKLSLCPIAISRSHHRLLHPTQTLDPDSYESWAGVPIAVVTVSLAIATTAVCLWTYARAVLISQFGADDWAAIVALILAMGSGIMVAASAFTSSGRAFSVACSLNALLDTMIRGKLPSVDGTRELVLGWLQTFYISIVLYNGSPTATKLTFLLQYYRILGGTGQIPKAIMVAFVIIAQWSILQLLLVIFTYTPTPIQKFWLPEAPGTCIPSLPFWYVNAVGNIITDVIVFVLPLPVLSRLNLRRNQKLSLIAVFCLGFFASVNALHLSTHKLGSGITCACLPTLQPLLAKYLPSLQLQTRQSDSNNRKYYQRSSGRDGASHPSRLRSSNENGSSRDIKIMYPEDLELQSEDRFDKEIRVNVEPLVDAPLQLRTSQQRIRVGSPGLQTMGIEVKRDVVMAMGDRSPA